MMMMTMMMIMMLLIMKMTTMMMMLIKPKQEPCHPSVAKLLYNWLECYPMLCRVECSAHTHTVLN